MMFFAVLLWKKLPCLAKRVYICFQIKNITHVFTQRIRNSYTNRNRKPATRASEKDNRSLYAVAFLPKTLCRAPFEARRHTQSRRPVEDSIYHEAGFARQLPVRPVDGAFEPGGASAFLERHNRHADRNPAHAARPRRMGNAVARCLYMVGLRPGDIFQNSSGYGMFTGGLGFQYGAERLGMLTVPAAAGNTKRQIKFITDFGTTALHAIPSYAGRLYEVMVEMGIDPRRDTKLHTLIIGAEPHSEEQRRRIENMLGVKAYNSFGMSEMCGPGVAFECTEQNGLHIWEDYYIVEIVDPQTLEPVPEGEVGELVLTTINREAMPLLRYRTRDLTRILPGECPCGRHHKRLDRMKGRSDDMMILKGVNIFPIQIETVLMQFEELGNNYLITLTNEEANDLMTVEVELNTFCDDYPKLQALTKEITRQLKDEILLTPLVKLVPKGSLPQQDGKAVRVRDLRKTLI